MWRKIRNFLLIIGGIASFFFAISAFKGTGGKRVRNAIDKMEKAEEKKEQAKIIDAKVNALQEKKGKINSETKAKIKKIRKMNNLEEISNAFNKL